MSQLGIHGISKTFVWFIYCLSCTQYICFIHCLSCTQYICFICLSCTQYNFKYTLVVFILTVFTTFEILYVFLLLVYVQKNVMELCHFPRNRFTEQVHGTSGVISRNKLFGVIDFFTVFLMVYVISNSSRNTSTEQSRNSIIKKSRNSLIFHKICSRNNSTMEVSFGNPGL